MLLFFNSICLLSFLLVASLPSYSLLIAPLVLGLPHVVSDVYLLLVRERRIYRSALFVAIVLCLVLLLNGAVSVLFGTGKLLHDSVVIALLVALPVIWMSWLIGITFASGVAIVIAFLLLIFPDHMMLLMAYLHNFTAILFLFCNSENSLRNKVRAAVLIGGLSLAGAGTCIFLGKIFVVPVTDPSLEMVWSLVPAPDHPLAAPLLFLFAYTQLLHLFIWSWILPFGLLRTKDGRTLQTINISLIIVVSVFLLLFAPLLEDRQKLELLRSNYLLLVSFHGWLELTWILLRFQVSRGEGKSLTFRPFMNLSEV